MTRKDYERAAKIIRARNVTYVDSAFKQEAAEHTASICETFVAFFRGDNPDFDAKRFRDACDPNKNLRKAV